MQDGGQYAILISDAMNAAPDLHGDVPQHSKEYRFPPVP